MGKYRGGAYQGAPRQVLATAGQCTDGTGHRASPGELGMAWALPLILNTGPCNFNFFKPAGFLSEEVDINLKTPVSLMAALTSKMGGIHQLRDDPLHESSLHPRI